jgi:hypothetical protein
MMDASSETFAINTWDFFHFQMKKLDPHNMLQKAAQATQEA